MDSPWTHGSGPRVWARAPPWVAVLVAATIFALIPLVGLQLFLALPLIGLALPAGTPPDYDLLQPAG